MPQLIMSVSVHAILSPLTGATKALIMDGSIMLLLEDLNKNPHDMKTFSIPRLNDRG